MFSNFPTLGKQLKPAQTQLSSNQSSQQYQMDKKMEKLRRSPQQQQHEKKVNCNETISKRIFTID